MNLESLFVIKKSKLLILQLQKTAGYFLVFKRNLFFFIAFLYIYS